MATHQLGDFKMERARRGLSVASQSAYLYKDTLQTLATPSVSALLSSHTIRAVLPAWLLRLKGLGPPRDSSNEDNLWNFGRSCFAE